MHIHSANVGLQPIASYAAGNDRAVAAQRAAETRKRLLKSAQSIEAESDPDTTLFIGQWRDGRLDSRHSQVLPGDEYRSGAQGDDTGLA